MSHTQAGISFDGALIHYVGQFGRGQSTILLAASCFYLSNAFAFLIWVFMTLDPVARRWWECTLGPEDSLCWHVLNSDRPTDGFCQLETSQWKWTSNNYSVVSEFSLVCDRAWLVQLTNCVTFVGCFIGSGLFGALCDRIGRKPPLFISTVLIAVASFANLAARNYWALTTLRALAGAGAAGQTVSIFLLSTESVGPSHRGHAGVASLGMYVLGEFVLLAMASALPQWRHLSIASGCMSVALLLVYPLVPESARWLLSTGKAQQATNNLAKLSISNKTLMPTQPLLVVDQESTEAVSLWHIMKNPTIRYRFLVLAYTWFAVLITFFGIALGSDTLPGSM